jgi:putative peptidoglycan lipid II flippase
MLTRAFFSLQRPWVPTTLAVGSLAINAVLSYVLAHEFGIAGIVIGTAVSNAALVVAEAIWLGGLEFHWPRIGGILVGSALLGGVSYGVWYVLDDLLGRSLIGQIISVGVALVAGGGAYAAVVLGLRIPEAQQVIALIRRRRS